MSDSARPDDREQYVSQESLRASTRRRMELVLARARVFLTLAAAICVYLDPTEPAYYAPLAYALLVFYIGVSATIALIVKARRDVPSWLQFGTHLTDIVWLSGMTLLTGLFNSPFTPFFTFVVLAAAYRWGLEETIATAGLLTLILFASVLGLGVWPALAGELMTGSFEPKSLAIRAAYIVTLAVLLGYLSREEKRLRRESSLIAGLVTRLRDAGLHRAIELVESELIRIFGARAAVIVAQNETGTTTYGWKLSSHPNREFSRHRLAPSESRQYFFPAPSTFVLAAGRRRPRAVLALDDVGRRVPGKSRKLETHPPLEYTRALVTSAQADEWFVRVFVFDPQLGMRGESALGLLQRLAVHSAPALVNTYLVSQLRSRAAAAERAKLARDLHDTSVQSLIALEMELLALTRQTADNALRAEVHRVRSRLQGEIEALRRLTDNLHPRQAEVPGVNERLAAILAQFQIETGIRARLVSRSATPAPAHLTQEILHIVHAALSNVRRHSRAGRVDVGLAHEKTGWQLTIEDDGTGALEAGRGAVRLQAPRTIKERVDALGGRITVEPRADAGVRLQIIFPTVASVR